MSQSYFQSATWYKATTLTERIASLHNNQSDRTNSHINPELQKRQIQRWKSQSPFSNNSYFSQRLAQDGVTEDEFCQILGESIETVQNRCNELPDWLTQINQAFADPNSRSMPSLEEFAASELTGFLDAILPLINQGCDRLYNEIQELIKTQFHIPFNPNHIVDLLFSILPEQLLSMLGRTMVLELNVTRLQGVLSGDTQQERFQSFLQHLRQPEIVLSLLQEYPVLARQLVITINRWVNFSLEFLQHLCEDWKEIVNIFSSDNAPGFLVKIDGNLGDTHRGGRSVLIAHFSSGLQIVYKPRPLDIEVHFQQLLTWLNQRGNHPAFRILKILNRKTHGWVEFAIAQGCTEPDGIERFYERQGAYLALLYALEATDFHLENLIAAGEHPVLVDLESLFHLRTEGMEITHSDLPTVNQIIYSVLRVGLLPQRLWANAESEGVDLSGLGGTAGQLTPYRVSHLEAIGTDEMRFVRERMPMFGSQNRPTLNDAEVNVLDYTEAIITGFTIIYQLLLQYRDELLSENGPLACFAEDEVRVIFRSTRTYSLLLSESFHPDFLRNALERDRHFDRLWVGIEQQPYLAKIIAAERYDLWQGDIPMFTTRPNSRAIWSSCDRKIADFFDETGMQGVHRRIQLLNEADLQQQLWFIRASVTTLVMGEAQVNWPSYHLSEPRNNANPEQLIKAALAVGDRLESLALRDDKNVSWLGLTLINEKYWTLASLRIDLYDGLSGVILFLAYLGSVTQENRYTTLAKNALSTMQRQLETDKAFTTAIGGFNGWGGIIYTLTHLGVLWDETELLVQAESLVDLLPNLIAKDEQLDIIGGAAGCIASLLNLYQIAPSQSTLAAAIQCGDRLLARVQTMENGMGWIAPRMGKKPLAGFSHGVAGIASALLELSAITSDERYYKVALKAITYEQSLLCHRVGNWPDLRELENTVLSGNQEPVNFITAWCHGAPGVGLGRLRSLSYLDNAEIRLEIDTVLKTTLTQGFGLNHCLCHGDLGNLEMLLLASLTLNDSNLHSKVNSLAAIILESINQHGWLCGVPLGVETPGLMTGLAGIGYELLRLAEPSRIPSVLTLAPPTPLRKEFLRLANS
ncbi:MAG: type 2 lanthipeptide synthetase LanM family protein [Nostoc sp. ChiSLP02]|nr:type 2 lanthipeptide synthetase LanM family protein [Nostoc sp. DedSLP05]MDZ8102336.1 type 2 lanthipeptide synthetase LanM family protein [Nostoc sp. DedSLP01]MDZ8188411.1 type 2 lanthipeptide synthetase LanM family protein [Nostoc sp. ChiSLP02]